MLEVREVPWVTDMVNDVNKTISQASDRRTPSKHVKATLVYQLQKLFLDIKGISGSAAIDEMCLSGLHKLTLVVNKEGLQEDLDIIKERMIDPMC